MEARHIAVNVTSVMIWVAKKLRVQGFWMIMLECQLATLFEIFIFGPKIQLRFPEKKFFGVKNSWKCCGLGLFSSWQLWFHEKNYRFFFGWKTRENVLVLDFLAVDNFDFTRKIVKKNWMEKLWNWIFGQKFDFSNSVLAYCPFQCLASKQDLTINFQIDKTLGCLQKNLILMHFTFFLVTFLSGWTKKNLIKKLDDFDH